MTYSGSGGTSHRVSDVKRNCAIRIQSQRDPRFCVGTASSIADLLWVCEGVAYTAAHTRAQMSGQAMSTMKKMTKHNEHHEKDDQTQWAPWKRWPNKQKNQQNTTLSPHFGWLYQYAFSTFKRVAYTGLQLDRTNRQECCYKLWSFLKLVASGFLRVLRFPPLLHRFNDSANKIKLK